MTMNKTDIIYDVTKSSGLDPQLETNLEQLSMYLEAFEVFGQRNGVRQDLWRKYGAEDTLMHMRSKMSRVRQLFSDRSGTDGELTPRELEELTDDALDLINYTVFFLRNLREHNYEPEDD